MDADPIDSLRYAAEVLSRQNDPRGRAVAEGFRAYLSGDADSLDDALGQRRAPGERRPSTKAMHRARDALLREAAAEFFPARRPSPARELHKAITRYAATGWLRECHLAACPAHREGTVQAVAWAVLKLENRVLSAKRIREVLAMN